MNKTKIEYVDYTWNPVTGCLGPGGTPENRKRCPYCYAHRLARGRLKERYLENLDGCMVPIRSHRIYRRFWDPFWPRLWEKRIGEPLRRRKPARILVCSMGDLFHDWVPWEWIAMVRRMCEECGHHTFLFLSKNPARYKEFEPWPENCWLGVTATNQRDWDERWPVLHEVDCAIQFVSLEPLLGRVRPGPGLLPQWVIIGALTGLQARQPQLDWIAHQFRLPGYMPIFTKDNLNCEAIGIRRRSEWPR